MPPPDLNGEEYRGTYINLFFLACCKLCHPIVVKSEVRDKALAVTEFNITLPEQIADIVRSKVSAGEYASESEVMQEGLLRLLSEDKELDEWIVREVLPVQQAMHATPSRARSMKQVEATLDEAYFL